MYIKLNFIYTPWACIGAGITATLAEPPVIVPELPSGVKADIYSEQLKSFLGKGIARASYFHDCKDLNLEDVNKILEIFKHQYNEYKEGLPGADLAGYLPKDNEIISNLRIAHYNFLHPEDTKEFESEHSQSGKTWVDNTI